MADYRPLLKTVGISLIIVGIVDIGVMIYCIAHGTGYSSSFNIFAVVAGILLVRGSLKTAHIVAWFSAFLLAGLIGMLLLAPFMMPLDLILAYFRFYPRSFGGSIILGISLLIYLQWIYRRLTDSTISTAMEEAKIDYLSFRRKTSTGFISGSVLALILYVSVSLLFRGETADQAKARAQLMTEAGYKFFVTSIRRSSSGGKIRVQSRVVAYNSNEIKQVEVNWEE